MLIQNKSVHDLREGLEVKSETVRKPSPSWIYWAVAALCFLLLMIHFFWRFSPKDVLFTNDMALTFAVAKLNLLGEFSLLGPPSHLGGRHLGPIFYWYVSLGLALARGNVETAIYLFAIAKLTALSSLLLLIPKLVPRSAALFAAIGFTLCLVGGMYEWVIHVPWHNNFLIIPGTAYIWMVYAALRCPRRYFPPLLVGASLLLQSHLSTLPLVVSGIFLVAARVVMSKPRAPLNSTTQLNFKSPFWIAALVASWLPLIVYEVLYPSNIAGIVNAHLKHRGKHAGIGRALSEVGEFFFRFSFRDYSLERLVSPVPAAFGALLLAGFLVVAVDGLLRGRNREVRIGLRAVAFTSLVFVVFLSAVKRPLYDYYLSSALALPPLFIALVVAHGAELFFNDGRKSKLSSIPAFACSCGFCLLLARAALFNVERAPAYALTEQETLRHAEEVARIIAADKQPTEQAQIQIAGPSKRSERENAIHFLLGSNQFHLMKGSGAFDELPSFAQNKEGAASLLYLEACNVPDLDLNSNIGWEYNKELPCPSCGGCRLVRFSKSP